MMIHLKKCSLLWAVFPWMLFFGPAFLYAQPKTKIELHNADSLVYDELSGRKFRRLMGHVAFSHDKLQLFCDSAYLYSEANSVDAFGNVRIRQGDTLHIRGGQLKYDGNTRMAELSENVVMSDGKMTLTTDHMVYDRQAGVARYTTGGTIVDRENILSSKKGYYHSASKDMHFSDSVRLTNPQFLLITDTLRYNSISKTTYFLGPTRISTSADTVYCERGWYQTETRASLFSQNAEIRTGKQRFLGDTLYYDRQTGRGKAYGHVSIIDTSEHIIVGGDYAEYDGGGENVFVTGRALLQQIFDRDTLFLHADTLMALQDSFLVAADSQHIAMRMKDRESSKENVDKGETGSGSIKKRSKNKKSKNEIREPGKVTVPADSMYKKVRVIYAYHHVKLFKKDLQGKCDSMVFSYKDSLMRMYREPVIWSEKNQLTAEHIQIKMKDGEIHNMFLLSAAFITSQEDSLRYNQVKGKNMTGYFVESSLHRIRVEGNGQTIYYGKDKQNKYLGVNRADCSDMEILVEDNEIKSIVLLNMPDATFYPVRELSPQELLLKGFSWQAKSRPLTKEDIFRK